MSIAVEKWSTPEEELNRLLPSKQAFQSSMLRRKEFLLDPMIPNHITDYFIRFLPQLTYWHTALKKLDLLPDQIPALPRHIHEILFTDCPIMKMEKKKKANDEAYKIIDTHSLYLIPPNSLDDLRNRTRALSEDAFFIGFRQFYDSDHFGHMESDHWQWTLIPNTVMEKSREETYEFQEKMIENLSQSSACDYEIGGLREMGAFLLLDRVATRRHLYDHASRSNGYRSTYASVQETNTYGNHLVIGATGPSGINIDIDDTDWFEDDLGIATLCKLS